MTGLMKTTSSLSTKTAICSLISQLQYALIWLPKMKKIDRGEQEKKRPTFLLVFLLSTLEIVSEEKKQKRLSRAPFLQHCFDKSRNI